MYEKISKKLKEQLADAPKKPGVYIYRSKATEVIYVGKAVNLFNRTHSYFSNYERLDPRLKILVETIHSIEYLVVDNEIEALLLETNLIKKYTPQFNILMTDDKSYLWVKIYKQMDFPQVTIVRQKKDDNADYFGPFPARAPIKRMLKQLRKVFMYRSCNRIIEERGGEIYSSDKKPCLYYHIGLCSGPCMTQMDKEVYRKQINDLKRFMRSEHSELKNDLRSEMNQHAVNREYELAAGVRNQLRDLEYLTQYTRIDETIDDIALKRSKQEESIKGVEELTEILGITYSGEVSKFKIECYDISNIQGTNATAAMVVSVGGQANKQLYRKFKIKSKSTPDDFAMLQETITRRIKYLTDTPTPNSDESFTLAPNLMVIDGGKGQLSSVLEVLTSNYTQPLPFPCVGLAKRDEEIIVPNLGGKRLEFKVIRLPRRSSALRILQQIRDEAHRFGLGYHRLLRSKGMTFSSLDLVPGVGKVIKEKLIIAFGSVEGIKKAKIAEIESVVKNKTTALKIKKLLR